MQIALIMGPMTPSPVPVPVGRYEEVAHRNRVAAVDPEGDSFAFTYGSISDSDYEDDDVDYMRQVFFPNYTVLELIMVVCSCA